MFANVYKNRRVLITGHTGFKGTWLTAWLLSLGAKVAGFAVDIPSTPSAFTSLGLQNKITHTQADIRDSAAILRAVQEFKPHIIFHMAAQALVRPSYEDPGYTFETNAMGTLHLLEAVRQTPGVEAVVCITSDKCYRNDEWVWGYRERDHLGGEDPYSASKACAEIIAHSYFKSFFKQGPSMATVRAGNVIGGGDWAVDRIVPDCARAWAAGEPVVIRSPQATRPWQHVLEPLSGYLWLGALLATKAETPLPLNQESFNFGPAADVNATVAQVSDALAAHWAGFAAEMDRNAVQSKKECTLLKLCCDKALAHLHWHATLPFTETIRYTAEWYRAFYKEGPTAEGEQGLEARMFAFTAGQIAAYAAAANKAGLAWAKE